MKPRGMIAFLPETFPNKFGCSIMKIYDHPIFFAHAILNYFNLDKTDLNAFAFSTFPAIYGHFSDYLFRKHASIF
jgi:hypothetical protein